MKNFAGIRKEYSKASLDLLAVDKNPITQFSQWFDEAEKSDVPEVNAMTLSTVSESGRPSSRIVLLKGIEGERFVFYTNYQGQKGKELEQNPACALNFFWPELERQIRIEGIATKVDPKISDAYFQSRPRTSQIGAWASPQSTTIASRKILEERAKEIELRFKDQKVLPRPHQWGGFAVEPLRIEFWQGRESRLHDRVVYTKVNEVWRISQLAP